MPASTAAKVATQWRRRSLVARSVVLVALAILAIGGCGSGANASVTKVDLTYVAGGVTKAASLNCPADSEAANGNCDAIEKLPASAFKPVPKGAVCTMIFGGPETATIKGTVNGTKVDAKYSRSNGCEIARWNKVEQLFAEMAGN